MDCSQLVLILSGLFALGHCQVTLSVRPNLVVEANTYVEACATLIGSIDRNAFATLRTQDVTATAGSDYEALSARLTFTPAQGQGGTLCHQVVILDDNLVENEEYLMVELVGEEGIAVLSPSSVTITIQQNISDIDTITVSFQQPNYTVMEDAGSLEVCLIIDIGGVETTEVEVDVTPMSSTAEEGKDFSSMALAFTFSDGSVVGTTSCQMVDIFTDNFIEGDEKFLLSINPVQNDPVSGESSVSVTIVDVNAVTLQVAPPTTVMLFEGNPSDPQENVEICVQLVNVGGILQREVVFNFIPVGGTADTEDYILSDDATLASQGDTECINVTIINDDVREANETLILRPMSANSRDIVTGVNFTLVILDDGDENCAVLSNPTGGRVSFANRRENSTATYSCNNTHILCGDTSRVCGADGVWSGQEPVCLINCGPPPSPSSGQVEFTATKEGSEAVYTCDGNLTLMGDSRLLCLNSGMWSGPAPMCVETCEALMAPDNGNVMVSGLTATYSCDDGYDLSGPSVRTCGTNRQWSGRAPICRREGIVCPELQDPANGDVDSDGLMATYTCNEGFPLMGDEVRQCDSEGEWLGEEPTCSGIKELASLTAVLLGVILFSFLNH